MTLRRISVNLRAPEAEIVAKMEEDGHEVSEIVRELLRKWGKENYPQVPAYAEAMKISAEIKKKKIEEQDAFARMPNEEYAEKILRGKVRGNQVEFRIASGNKYMLPLASIKETTLDNNNVVQIHNQLLARNFVYPNGQEPTKAAYARIWDGWEV